MNRSKAIRQGHRWLSATFATIVAVIFAMQGAGIEFASWIFYLPLPPLAFLMLTGLYMLFLPHFAERRRPRDRGVASGRGR